VGQEKGQGIVAATARGGFILYVLENTVAKKL